MPSTDMVLMSGYRFDRKGRAKMVGHGNVVMPGSVLEMNMVEAAGKNLVQMCKPDVVEIRVIDSRGQIKHEELQSMRDRTNSPPQGWRMGGDSTGL